ncbi:hypothetical protein SAMN02910453_0467 [Lachnospiraceae bacterium A10]|nr:hypothetical protein SAMN02910453_0467 [Lachnospiraceae bacterium A10]
MFVCTCLLFILPYFYGSMLLKKNVTNKLLYIPIGFIVEFVLWTVISLPFLFFNRCFKDAVLVFSLISVFYMLVELFIRIKNQRTDIRKEWDSMAFFLREKSRDYLGNKVFLIMLGVVLFQICRSVFFQYGYGDNRVYTAMVNDMVETGIFYPYDDVSGEMITSLNSIPKKYILSSWYTFEAAISSMADIKSLVLISTILPGFLIFIIYVIWWAFADVLFLGKISSKAGFLIALSLLLEFRDDDISSYMLYWPTYGKSITAHIIIVLFMLFWINNTSKRDIWNEVYLFLLMIAGCASSTMGLMIMPIELSLVTGITALKNKKITAKQVKLYVTLLIPVMIYAFLFLK